MPREQIIKDGATVPEAKAPKRGRKAPAFKPMIIEEWPIEKVIPYERNARKNDNAVDAVEASIKDFDWQQPLVVDKKGVLIIGHTRLKAAIKLGMTSVPVKVADLPADKVRRLRLADNKTHELAEWDNELLAMEMADMEDDDLTSIGFTDLELEDIRSEDPKEKKKAKGGKHGRAEIESTTPFQVIVQFSDKKAQKKLYDRLVSEKMICRMVTY